MDGRSPVEDMLIDVVVVIIEASRKVDVQGVVVVKLDACARVQIISVHDVVVVGLAPHQRVAILAVLPTAVRIPPRVVVLRQIQIGVGLQRPEIEVDRRPRAEAFAQLEGARDAAVEACGQVLLRDDVHHGAVPLAPEACRRFVHDFHLGDVLSLLALQHVGDLTERNAQRSAIEAHQNGLVQDGQFVLAHAVERTRNFLQRVDVGGRRGQFQFADVHLQLV